MKSKKTVIITGANSGMGYATTVELAKKGYHVVMACRDERRGLRALEEARKESDSPAIELMKLDLGSLAQIRLFAEEFRATYDVLDVLINNAGVMTFKRETTSDGFERMMGINHLGTFLLTNLLLDPLKLANQGRIVNVASVSHKKANLDLSDPYREKSFSFMEAYGQSKLANLLFTLELSDRMKDTQVTVNSLHPGTVSTNIGVDRNGGFWAKTAQTLMKPFVLSPLQGAETTIYLADSPEVSEISGKYFQNKRITSTSPQAQNKQLANQCWAWSEREVGETV
ncbi:MAG: SDR family oxidoreductase [Paenibacillaceae bacterium]|uniref:SDR family oxidoreductase n=1 Tax=Paenibacillus mellifer TaxID=2937794 RepID=A0A9X1Y231_9BACL|nr:SDR family oxidoreductase [Paenibacillus mellifer]MBW4840915.1 SDR family oxidoreductase [Paenibacillaceae bacterium]MCK8489344.1 SDR family oxidoreductase [Paenibacillus mellifer]